MARVFGAFVNCLRHHFWRQSLPSLVTFSHGNPTKSKIYSLIIIINQLDNCKHKEKCQILSTVGVLMEVTSPWLFAKKTVTGTVFQRSLPHIASDWWDYVSSQACHFRAHLKTHSGEKLNKCNQQCYEGSLACCHRPLTQFAWERDAKNPLKAFFAFSTGNHGSVPSWLVFSTCGGKLVIVHSQGSPTY